MVIKIEAITICQALCKTYIQICSCNPIRKIIIILILHEKTETERFSSSFLGHPAAK